MRVEDKFLDIYNVVFDERLEVFKSSDICDQVNHYSAGISSTIIQTIRKYDDLPIVKDRESPADPYSFRVEEFLNPKTVEEILEDENEEEDLDPVEQITADFKEDIERGRNLDEKDLTGVISDYAGEYVKSTHELLEATGEALTQLEEDGMIKGNQNDGYRIN